MSEYLVEFYLSRWAANEASPSPTDVAGAADQLTREGRQVRLVQALFVPEDETCFYLFEANSSEAVLEAVHRCGLRFERLVEAESGWSSLPRPSLSIQSKETK